MNKVNLDAMIVREDFNATEGFTSTSRIKQIDVNSLKHDSMLTMLLRKPDFQRETRDWDIEQLCNFLKSIINRHFIPAIILWQNSSALTFVIDGAHRLSALMAWINDDYGDGVISAKFYNNNINEEQKNIAQKTRKKVDKEIGNFKSYMDAIIAPSKYDEEFCTKAKAIMSFSFDIQWIEGDVSVAEKSFFNINQKAVPINSTELAILESRTKPSCIATRAITYSGNGYKYWKNFSKENQEAIELLSKSINELLFLPPIKTPLTTLDVSLAGKNQNNLAFYFDLVQYSIGDRKDIQDTDGNETIKILSYLKKLLEVMNSKEPCSLGLHPIIYFYSKNGNFKPAIFYATFLFVKRLYENDKLKLFTKNREKFENFIYKYDYVIDQINRNARSSKKSATIISNLYFDFLDMLENDKSEDDILSSIISKSPSVTLTNDLSENLSHSKLKNATYISAALSSVLKCPICGGAIHTNSTSLDHIERKRDGGVNSVANAQITHPYCNTGFKN